MFLSATLLPHSGGASPDTDPPYNITLAQLLNFTSGLTQEAGCMLEEDEYFISICLRVNPIVA